MENGMMDSVEARVARGAALLDEKRPGWERKIDLAVFALDDGCKCVVGQLFGDYIDGIGLLGCPGPWNTALDLEWERRHGFLTSYGESWSWEELEEAWASLLKERFDSGNLSDA